MASLSTKYIDSVVLKALLSRTAEMFNYLNTKVDGIDYSAYFAGVSYDSTAKTITFTNSSGTTVGTIDTSDFVVDGMISSVEVASSDADGNEGTYLHFTFNTDSGAEDIYVDVSSLVDTYTAGNGIDITDNVVSVKKSDSSEDYLSVDEDGVAVTGVDAIATRVTALETWVDDNVITEDELDTLILEVEDETGYGMATAMGVSASE